jgi:succinate-acetate transporter protein
MTATVEALGVEAARVPAKVELASPAGVHIGAGGNPIVLGIACFGIAATCLGMVLIGVVPLTVLAIIVPIIAGCTGFFQIIATVWAIVLGQTFVAVVFGLFSGFWWSLSALLLGLGHDWYGAKPVADNLVHIECLFFIAWTVMFFFLLIPSLRLPALYPAIVADVVLALITVTLAIWNASTGMFTLTGWILLVGAGMGFWVFLNNASQSLGGPASPSLGPPIVK